MKDQDFSPRESLERAFQRWWVIVLLTSLGGIAGWAIHFLLPPLYEATTVITVNMDFQKVKLTQAEEDRAFNVAGAIGVSTKVENQIVTEAQVRGFPIDINHLTEQMFLERRQSVWEFHIRSRDPKTAAELANIWAEKTLDALNTALGSAIRADQIQAQIDNITSSQATSGSSVLSPKTQVALKNLSKELLQEKKLSRGVISIMKFSLTGTATVPPKPALYNLAELVLAGGCIGFVISMWVVSSYKVISRG